MMENSIIIATILTGSQNTTESKIYIDVDIFSYDNFYRKRGRG